MKNTIVLVIALVFTVVNNSVLTAKPLKSQTSEADKKKTKTELKAAARKASKTKVQKSKKASKVEAKRLRAEVREWQKRKKNMEPLQLKDLVEENHRLKAQNRKLDINVQELEEKLKAGEEKSAQLARLKSEIDTLKKAAISAISTPIALEELPAGSYSVDEATGQVLINGVPDNRYGFDKTAGKPFIKGVIFKVQVSADRDLDLSDVLVDDSHHKNLEQEEAEGVNKYTIGHFRNYWEADKLKKGLRKMGIRWAWIVPYKDGKRVLLKEVLSTVIEQEE
ncbi:MAG: hypothetical protein AAF392_01105 [Bacteroidota bacterium]